MRDARSFGNSRGVVCTAGMLLLASRRRLIPACALALLLGAAPALAEEPAPAPVAMGEPPKPPAQPVTMEDTPKPPAPDFVAELRRLGHPVDADFHLFTSLEFGRGLRFNNPYRLATELGSDARSLSLIAPYGDLGLGFAYGPPDGVQYGGAIHASIGMAGVLGFATTVCFQATYRGPRRFMAYGRLGPGINTPEVTLGGEVAGGFGWFLTGHVAVAGELVFDTWLGAGTRQVAVAVYPVLAAQLGLLVDYELME